MSLVNCPECGHDVSSSAVACPRCGRPLQIRAVPATPVVADTDSREKSFPNWVFVALGGVLLLVLLFIFGVMSRDADDEANTNVRVRAETERLRGADRDERIRDTSSTGADIPSTSGAEPVNVPGSSSTVPGSQTKVDTAPDKASVRIEAKVITRDGSPQAVRNEKFYLLERDLERILSEAGLEPIDGNTLANSFGLAVMFPDRYRDFYRDAMRAVNKHIEYSGTTDTAGRTELTGVAPGSYYLFGITKTGGGFALWSAPVSIVPGENVLNLAPQRISEMEGRTGE